MNYAIVFRLLGYILMIEGTLLLLPAVTSLIYAEWAVMGVFLLTAAISAALGFALRTIKPRSKVFYMREGFTATALSWITISIMGAVPFVLTGCIPNPVDAMFETVSGFTTTGASILPGVEGLPNGILFWRSFTHWIGGMGVFVFIMAILPMMGGSTMNLMRAESPGPSVSKLVPRVRDTAKILYGLYMAITVLGVIMLCLCGMPLFDSLCTTFGSVGTGGFGVKNSSIGGYSPLIQNAVTVLMILSGVNYTVYFCLLSRQFKEAFSIEEVRWYFLIIFASALTIAWNIRPLYTTLGETLRHSFFQVGTIITTTGFATTDFNMWPQLSKTILLLLMMIGACAGSTTGGIKIDRLVLIVKNLKNEMYRILFPNAINPVRVNGKVLSNDMTAKVCAFLLLFALSLFVGSLALSLSGINLFDAIFTSMSCLSNNGLGYGFTGQNFADINPYGKWVLSFIMLVGRLEFSAVMILLTKAFWSK